MRRGGSGRTSPSCRTYYASEPFSRLFERAWALSSSTRRLAAQIPTIPCSTRRASTPVPPRAVAAAMVTDDGQPDGCERHYRPRGSTTWQSHAKLWTGVTVLRSVHHWWPPANGLEQRPTAGNIEIGWRSLILLPSLYSPPQCAAKWRTTNLLGTRAMLRHTPGQTAICLFLPQRGLLPVQHSSRISAEPSLSALANTQFAIRI